MSAAAEGILTDPQSLENHDMVYSMLSLARDVEQKRRELEEPYTELEQAAIDERCLRMRENGEDIEEAMGPRKERWWMTRRNEVKRRLKVLRAIRLRLWAIRGEDTLGEPLSPLRTRRPT